MAESKGKADIMRVIAALIVRLIGLLLGAG